MSSRGLEITWRTLATTANEAAVDVLLIGLESSSEDVAFGALRALLERRYSRGAVELVRRWDRLAMPWKEEIARRADRLSGALRDALVSDEAPLCVNASQAAVWLREYDLTPVLVNVAESPHHGHRELAAQTLLRLAELLHEDLASSGHRPCRSDPHVVRTRVVTALEKSLQRWPNHRRLEILEAFLLLCPRDNVSLKQILNNPHEPTYLKVLDLLAHSRQPGVMRLLLSFLDDRRAPTAALQTLARRSDKAFLTQLLKKVGYEPSAAARRNLKLIRDFPWVRTDAARVDGLDDAGQHAVVQMAVASSMKRSDVFQLIEHLLRSGRAGGRRAAAEALRHFQGVEANDLVLGALHDRDPLVQAAALGHLRQRGLPGAMTRLLELLDSPHESVRAAVRKCLSEFSCTRFLQAFDMLTPEARESTGQLVGRIDLQAAQTLREELASPVRNRKFRAVEAAAVIGVAAALEEPLLELLEGDDHLLRVKAAEALRHCDSDRARQALRERLLDPHPTVQEAAEASLQHLSRAARESPPAPEPGSLTGAPLFFPLADLAE